MNDYKSYLKSLDDETLRGLVEVFSDSERVKAMQGELSDELCAREEKAEEKLRLCRKTYVGKYYRLVNDDKIVFYYVKDYDELHDRFVCDILTISESEDETVHLYSFSRYFNTNVLVEHGTILSAPEVTELVYNSALKTNGRVRYITGDDVKEGLEEIASETNKKVHELYERFRSNDNVNNARKFLNHLLDETAKFIEENNEENR